MVSQGWRCPANRVDVSRARLRSGFHQQVAYSQTGRASQPHDRKHTAASRCDNLAFSLADGLSTSWQRQELERVFCQEAGCLVDPVESSTHSSVESGATSAGPLLERPRAIAAISPEDAATSDTYKVQLGNGPEPPKQRMKPDDDFYANVGDAIRTLREDVPVLFKRDLNYDIYREDVVFCDPRNCFRGMDNYKLIFWSLRFHGKLFFKELYVEVKRIWQKSDDTICLRWTVHGFPRLPWDQEGLFDGISTYKLDSHGKIYEHKVDNVMLSDPPMQRLPLLIKVNLAPVQQPYPSPWLELPDASACSDTQGNASFEC